MQPGKASPDSGLPTPEGIQGGAYRGSVGFNSRGYIQPQQLTCFQLGKYHQRCCAFVQEMNRCRKGALPKTTLKFYDSLLFHYKILFETLSDVRKSVAAKLISQRFTSPAHLGANKTHHSVWLLSFEFSSVITKLLPKVLSVLVLPQ